MGLIDNCNVQVNGSQDILSTLTTYKTVVQKPNIRNNRNTLTQIMMSEKNTKYVIKWNFVLDGNTITVPENCIIEFDGGSISNGTLVGQDTILIYSLPLEDVVNNVNLEGTFIHKNGGNAADGESIGLNDNKELTVLDGGIHGKHLNEDVADNETIELIDGKLKLKVEIPVVPENVATINSGNTLPDGNKVGEMFFYNPDEVDEDDKIPVWWNGSNWVDATGSPINA